MSSREDPDALAQDDAAFADHDLHREPVTNRENILRGFSPSAVHARADRCPKGHPYDGANTVHRPSGRRGCRSCNAADVRSQRSCSVCSARVSRPSIARHLREIHALVAA